MQTVSLLRLLEANITKPFMSFLDSLKWLNLHFDVDLKFASCDDAVCWLSVFFFFFLLLFILAIRI